MEDIGLFLITASDFPPDPAELLDSQQMEELCQALRKEYDYIIADLPPVGGRVGRNDRLEIF